jgi:hypothetical protein
MDDLKTIQMIHMPTGLSSIFLGIAGGLTAAMISGIGVTLGVTALVSLTSIVFKEIGVRLIKRYDIFIIKRSNKKRKKNEKLS